MPTSLLTVSLMDACYAFHARSRSQIHAPFAEFLPFAEYEKTEKRPGGNNSKPPYLAYLVRVYEVAFFHGRDEG